MRDFFTTSGFFFGFCIIPPSQTPDGWKSFPGRSGVGQRQRVSGSGFRGAALVRLAFTLCILAYYVGMSTIHESASCGGCDMWLRSVRNTMHGQMK